jgi:TolA-binding protein
MNLNNMGMHQRGIWGLAGLLLLGGVVRAQEAAPLPLTETNTGTLKTMADDAIAGNDPAKALPILTELIARLQASTNAQIMASLEPLYYYQGMAAMQLDIKQIETAEQAFKEYIRRFPEGPHLTTVQIRLGDALMRLQRYLDAINWYQKVLDKGKTIQLPASQEQELKEKIADAYLEGKLWDKAIPYLQETLKTTRDPQMISQAAVSLIQCFIETNQPEKTIQYLSYVESRSAAARHSIEFNLTLMRGGDRAFGSGKYPEALYLYQLALDKEELAAWHQAEIAKLEEQRKVLLQARNMDDLLAVNARIDRSRQKLEVLNSVADYTQELMLRMARAYFELNRKYEAMWAFFALYKDFKKSSYGEQALYATFGLASELDMVERAEDLGKTFMETYPQSQDFGTVALMMGQLYLNKKQFPNCLALFSKIFELKKGDASADYLDEMMYYMGYAYFQDEKLEEAQKTFQQLRKQFPQSPIKDGADYWMGMSFLFLKNYQAAKEEFVAFTQKYTKSDFLEDATFRVGVSEYGLLDFKGAKVSFAKFNQKYPESKLRGEAHMFLGDIAAADSQVEEAIKEYREVAKCTDNMLQINYAIFQIGNIYEQLGDYQKMDELFSQYLREYGTKGNYTEAVYRIGHAKRNRGDVEGSLKIYQDAIQQYANDPAAIGIDFILADWPAEYKTVKGKFPLAIIQDEIKKAQAAKQRTAELRWRWAGAKAGENPAADFVLQDADYELASPGTLVWMAELNRDKPELAKKANLTVLKKYGTSEWILQPLKNLAEQEGQAKNYPKAVEYLRVIQEKFATSPEAAYATKREADFLRETEKYTEAIALYEKVVENKEWRGPLWPESIYQIGACYFAQHDLKKAFAYFQRVYVLYQGYPEWAVKAYLMSGTCLEQLKDRPQAIATYQEMLLNKELEPFPEFAQAKERLGSLQ